MKVKVKQYIVLLRRLSMNHFNLLTMIFGWQSLVFSRLAIDSNSRSMSTGKTTNNFDLLQSDFDVSPGIFICVLRILFFTSSDYRCSLEGKIITIFDQNFKSHSNFEFSSSRNLRDHLKVEIQLTVLANRSILVIFNRII